MMLRMHIWPVIAVVGGTPVVFLGLAVSDWSQIIQSLGVAVASGAAGVGGAAVIYLKAYEGSAKQQAEQLKGLVEMNGAQIRDLKASNEDQRKEIVDLREKIAARDRSIALRDDAIKLRDLSIDSLTRSMTRLGEDAANMAVAFLILKGDAKVKEVPGA